MDRFGAHHAGRHPGGPRHADGADARARGAGGHGAGANAGADAIDAISLHGVSAHVPAPDDGSHLAFLALFLESRETETKPKERTA